MRKRPHLSDISECNTIEGLQKALDDTYRQLLEMAKADWGRLFGGLDPADACVTVQVSKTAMADELAGVPRAGYLSKTRDRWNGRLRRRIA